jgi:hypothetical protein
MAAQGSAQRIFGHTCTLPDARRGVCASVLNHFVALYG